MTGALGQRLAYVILVGVQNRQKEFFLFSSDHSLSKSMASDFA